MSDSSVKQKSKSNFIEKFENVCNKVFDDKKFYMRHKWIILAFVAPFLFMFVSFALQGVAPFGNNQILVTDLWHQMYPFMVDFQDKLQSGGSLLWTWKVGGGTNFIALMSYYLASPLNFLFVFVPAKFLRQFLYFITCVKIGCAGGFFAIFLKLTFKKEDASVFFFSLMYGLCSFIMGYYWCVIWLDTIALLPLVVAGTFALLREGKFKLYIITLALSILANYYIGLFTCVFIFIVCLGYTIVEWTNFKTALLNLLKMAGATAIGIGITAILTIPTLLALGRAHSAASTFPANFAINMSSSVGNNLKGVLDAAGKTISNSIAFINPTTKEGLPNIYCGVIALVLAGLFFTCGKIKIRERIFCGVLELFFIYSFIDRRLDYMWHGFHFPNMLPYRFSFLFSFVLIYMAFRVYQNFKYIRLYQVLIAAGIFMVIIGIAVNFDETLPLVASAFIGFLVIVWAILTTLKVVPAKAFAIALCIIAIAEGACTAYLSVRTVSVTSANNYPNSYKSVEASLEKVEKAESDTVDLYHVDMCKYHTLNDSALYGVNGISEFNSIATESVSKFLETFGICSWPGSNRYTYQDSSCVTDLLLNMKYKIATNDKYLDTKYDSLFDEQSDTKLLKVKNYIKQGFVVNEDVLTYNVENASSNPLDNQNELWKKMTGLDEDVYDYLEVVSQGHTDYKDFPVNKDSYGHYTFSTNKDATPHLKYNYTAPYDGSAVIYFKANGCENCTLKVNDEDVNSNYIKRPYIMNLGTVKKGDKLSVYADVKEVSSGNVEVYCAMVKDDVFKKGYDILNQSVLDATKITDTLIEGNIDVKDAGVMYTSIACDPGWKAYIDGNEVTLDSVDGGFLALKISEGKHTIKLTYMPEGFLLGTACTITCIILLVLVSILVSVIKKKKKQKPLT